MLSVSEIRRRAMEFSQRWKNETSEDAEAKVFWHEFFTVFGMDRKRVAAYEHQVAKAGERKGYIDMFWPGVCVVEHKSAGRDLDRAFSQALDYFPGLTDAELPRYVLVSDFQRIRLHDLFDDSQAEFQLSELPSNTGLFGFISGYVTQKYRDEDPANIKAAELMAQLHDALKANGYDGHQLEVFLVRILFCLFADDTGIFDRDIFVNFLETKTRQDGIDVGSTINYLFQILNTDKVKRPKNLDDEIAAFPYVNGSLFAEPLLAPTFDSRTRAKLVECAYFNWQNVSPAVFGSMFQSVMDAVERRNLGAHYTSEKNILKVVSGLFMDELREEFEKSKDNANKLRALHERMSNMRFLDPAAGCGNFLVVTFKELRLLEIDILKRLEDLGKRSGKGQLSTDVSTLSLLSVHSMYGIEIEEFPARIAEVALWLGDHQMNVRMSEEFGSWWVRLPLSNGPTIYNVDSLEMDWKSILNGQKDKEWFILGNPPFVGSRMMSASQKTALRAAANDAIDIGDLDYVAGWYLLAARAMNGTKIKAAFVSTNSIVQGLQAGILWKELFREYNVRIHFAHRTFRWSNEARGNAAVYCIIVGFSCFEPSQRFIHDYADINGDPQSSQVDNVNQYLVDAATIFIDRRHTPLCDVPPMVFGNMPADDGQYLFSDDERTEFLKAEPEALSLFRPFVSAREFLNQQTKWCLWLEDVEPNILRSLPKVLERIENVRNARLSSSRPFLAKVPHLFAQITQPKGKAYIVVPRVSSQTRDYIPMGFFGGDTIASDTCLIVPSASSYDFGILESLMHMAWVRQVCGRLKSDYRYSKDIVYNNFPWPLEANTDQKSKVEDCAQLVLVARMNHPTSSLADLYHPSTMPPDLRKAHSELDKAVDACYRKVPFKSERERVEYLFELYRKLTEGFGAVAVPVKKSRKKQT